MSAGCGVDGCGVLAVGRCRTCGQAFCGSHQAIKTDIDHRGFGRTTQTTLVDVCISCLTARQDKSGAIAAREQAASAQAAWSRQEAARSAVPAFVKRMNEYGNPGVTGFYFSSRRPSFWARLRRPAPDCHGWMVGEQTRRIYSDRSESHVEQRFRVVVLTTGDVVSAGGDYFGALTVGPPLRAASSTPRAFDEYDASALKAELSKLLEQYSQHYGRRTSH